MAVLEPLKVALINREVEPLQELEVANHPQNPEAGTRMIGLSDAVWIEREDFMVEPPKKYFRLGPGRCVRLRGGPIIRYVSHTTDSTGEVTEVQAEIIPETIGADAPEGIECRAAIHWVDVGSGIDAEIRLYDRLFNCEDPDAAEGGFLNALHPDSLKVLSAKIEPALVSAEPESSFQFERVGYFVTDMKDHRPGTTPVFNRTVALRDSWAKQAKR